MQTNSRAIGRAEPLARERVEVQQRPAAQPSANDHRRTNGAPFSIFTKHRVSSQLGEAGAVKPILAFNSSIQQIRTKCTAAAELERLRAYHDAVRTTLDHCENFGKIQSAISLQTVTIDSEVTPMIVRKYAEFVAAAKRAALADPAVLSRFVMARDRRIEIRGLVGECAHALVMSRAVRLAGLVSNHVQRYSGIDGAAAFGPVACGRVYPEKFPFAALRAELAREWAAVQFARAQRRRGEAELVTTDTPRPVAKLIAPHVSDRQIAVLRVMAEKGWDTQGRGVKPIRIAEAVDPNIRDTDKFRDRHLTPLLEHHYIEKSGNGPGACWWVTDAGREVGTA